VNIGLRPDADFRGMDMGPIRRGGGRGFELPGGDLLASHALGDGLSRIAQAGARFGRHVGQATGPIHRGASCNTVGTRPFVEAALAGPWLGSERWETARSFRVFRWPGDDPRF